MTTFKNNSKYAEVIFTYLDVAARGDTPLRVKDVLGLFEWNFKGGDMRREAQGTRLTPVTSNTVYPHGSCSDLLESLPNGRQYIALRAVMRNRIAGGRLRNRGVIARIGSFMMLASPYEVKEGKISVYTGMKAIYHLFDLLWEWALSQRDSSNWGVLHQYTRELMLSSASVSRQHLPTVDDCWERYKGLTDKSRLQGLMKAVRQIKALIALLGSGQARRAARLNGMEQKQVWEEYMGPDMPEEIGLDYSLEPTHRIIHKVGPIAFMVSQEVAMVGQGRVRYAIGKSDVERLHQLVMSAASALVGVCAQATIGTDKQRLKSLMAVKIAEANIQRIVDSSRLIPLGDEVLVCKGYRRAYTAHLGVLAGRLCAEETEVLIREAEETAPKGVLDVAGFLRDARQLDAASSLNACKMFKICPAPDVSPGAAMIDRVVQIGNGNVVAPEMMKLFEDELRSQILRAYIRKSKERLKLRVQNDKPLWYNQYLTGDFDAVPSSEIHDYLLWEGTAEMPPVSPYDPSNWKDSGLGADTIREAQYDMPERKKGNMITRLLFDDDCPMPGSTMLTDERVIKFFLKAEGHKDPARGIFSANLVDRQAQSWMERAVDSIAREHPSYMIGQEVDAREAKLLQLNTPPRDPYAVALFYSFDISGWSAKMPAEPQRISHKIWEKLYGGHLFAKAHMINEGAYIYLNIDGYRGWYENTHSNLEGFNGKEMTMVLVALLSLSVRRWREKVSNLGIMTTQQASRVSALLFAYIDDGLSRIDLPRACAVEAFKVYKETVIDTFSKCGFSVEVSKCFPSDRFSIFLNEVYICGRHVVHGVRAAMGISAEPTERHTSLPERVTSVSTGVRGAVMAGLNPLSAVMLMAYHVMLHLEEWVDERDPVILAVWSMMPRAWGGLGLPNMIQLYISGSGSAFEEGVGTMQKYAGINISAKKAYLRMARTPLSDRDPVSVMTAPLSGRVDAGYMVDSRIAVAVRSALQRHMDEGRVSRYAMRLLSYANTQAFRAYAESIIPRDNNECMQEQMLTNLAEAHPHSVFAAFARRVEKSMTVLNIVGKAAFRDIIDRNRQEARESIGCLRRWAISA